MARPREFDPDAALESAMRVFWAKGFEAASLDALCEATGLNRSSLYGAFGDKQALYFRALDHYEDASATRMAAALAGERPFRKAMAAVLQRMIDDIVQGPGRRGCFIGNCAAELAGNDRSAEARVRRSLARIESAIRDALGRARARGEFTDTEDIAALARFLTAGIQGLRLVGKTRPGRTALEDIAAVMLRCAET